MMSAAPLLGFAEATRVVYDYALKLLAHPPRGEEVALENALGRALGEPVTADRDMPAFARSTRDGYACRAAETGERAWLPVGGSIRAGDRPAAPLPPGSAWEIMTGAAVPDGADAVVMLEHVEHGEGKIRLAPARTLEPGENIVPAAAEARAGDELIASGTRLSPAHVAAAAACGYAVLRVFARPRVAILTTGDELVPVAEVPGAGQIRNSNAAMLAALIAQAGGEPWILPTAADEAESIDGALRSALDADMLLISGGVSAGKFDLVEPALARLGAQFHFTGVRIQPGKPLVFGEVSRSQGLLPLFGHPGNPISTAATFLLFAAPVLRALAGSPDIAPRFCAARMAREVKGKPGLTRFVPAHCSCDPVVADLPEAAPVPWQGSGDLAAFARANCFVMVGEGTNRLAIGELARILPI